MRGSRRARTPVFASLRKHHNYRLYFVGQIVSLCGSWMQDTALPWLVLERTHSPVAVGFLMFCRYTPVMLFGLFFGLLVDRFDNRRLLMATQAAAMAVATALALLTIVADGGPLWAIFLLATLGGFTIAVEVPTRQSLTYQLVGPAEVPNAVALNSGLINAARVVGPAIAGLIIAAGGLGICFAINAASFLAVLLVLALMRTAELYPLDLVGRATSSGVAALREGITYVRHSTTLRTVIILTACISFLGFNFRVLVPVLAARTLDGGPTLLGLLFTVFGAGAVAGALVSAGTGRPPISQFFGGITGFGASMLALAFVNSTWAAAILLFLVGLFFTTWTASGQTIIQLTTPDGLRGRVLGLQFVALAGVTPVGSILTGVLASKGGTGLAYAVAGCVTLVALGVAVARFRHEVPVPRLDPAIVETGP